MERNMSKDLISRQAAIDALRDYLVGKRCPDDGTLTCRLIENEVVNKLPSALSTNLASLGTDCISRQQAIDDIWTVSPLARLDRKWVDRWLRQLPSAHPEIIRCKDCKYWVPGYITDNDDFIPPKCGEWQQMVGHSSDDYCSLAERREVNNESN
jgi:hypothetical protein